MLCLSAGADGIRVKQDYDWPADARARCLLRDGDLLVVLGWGAGAVSSRGLPVAGLAGSGLSGVGPPTGGAAMEGLLLGVCLPWLRFGPLLPRGMLRQVADPLGFSPASDVFQERTTLVLDGELSSAAQGVLLMPASGLCGVFCRPVSTGGNEYGVFGRLPLAPGASVEAVVLKSRPGAEDPPDDWFLSHGPFPGGDVTELCARLAAVSPGLGFSLTSGISSATWTAPGAFTNLLVSGRTPWLQAAVLLAGVTSGDRSPDGSCAGGAARVSGRARLGTDRAAGFLEAGWSFSVATPPFAPGSEIPTRTTVRAELSRDFDGLSSPAVSIVIQGEKDISRESSGIRAESSRCGSTVQAVFPGLGITTGFTLSGTDGVGLLGAFVLKPSPRLRLLAEAGANRLATDSASASASVKASLEHDNQKAAVQAGFVDCPLCGAGTRLARCFRLSLSCTVAWSPSARVPWNPAATPSRPPG